MIYKTISLGLLSVFFFSNLNAEDKKSEGLLYKADKVVSTQSYGMAGCGLGSIVFGDRGGFEQVFAATTNGTSSNQTFAISSGTSNCEEGSHFRSAAEFTNFVALNRSQLEAEFSRGEAGESVVAMTLVSGSCAQPDEVSRVVQAEFEQVFLSSDHSEVADALMGHLDAICRI
jgi:hypothetical protein